MFDNSGDFRKEIMVCHGLPPNFVEYFQPGIVNRIIFHKVPWVIYMRIASAIPEAIQLGDLGVPKVPDSGVSSTTPPLAFGAGEVGSWSWNWSWVGVGLVVWS